MVSSVLLVWDTILIFPLKTHTFDLRHKSLAHKLDTSFRRHPIPFTSKLNIIRDTFRWGQCILFIIRKRKFTRSGYVAKSSYNRVHRLRIGYSVRWWASNEWGIRRSIKEMANINYPWPELNRRKAPVHQKGTVNESCDSILTKQGFRLPSPEQGRPHDEF